MFGWLKAIKNKRRMEHFLNEKRMVLNGGYGFSVEGNLVREFGYLLRHVTRGKHESFNNFEQIADDFVAIDGAIVLEMQAPREAEVMVSEKTALYNLKNMRTIVRCIAEYVDLARELGLPTNPDVH